MKFCFTEMIRISKCKYQYVNALYRPTLNISGTQIKIIDGIWMCLAAGLHLYTTQYCIYAVVILSAFHNTINLVYSDFPTAD